MKLNEFISNLLDIVNEKPELGNLEVVYESDEGGDQFNIVQKPPTFVKTTYFGKEKSISNVEFNLTEDIPNAIIIN